jgi:transcriptional regulator with XRE-family HTH domain
VIDVATLNVIRRWALREEMSIREISRRTGLARNTVQKYLNSDQSEPTYAKRVSSSMLDPYAEKLSAWLGIEATKSRKQWRNLKQIHTSMPIPHSGDSPNEHFFPLRPNLTARRQTLTDDCSWPRAV